MRSGDFDYITIGSGMGGLTCAAALAKMGRRVLVLEQHHTPGGYTHTFKRRQWRWDVGVHIVGEVTRDDEFGRLLHYLTDGRLEWAPLADPYDRYHWPGGFEVEYAGSEQRFIDTLVEKFPNERAVIVEWLARCQRAYTQFTRHTKTKILPPRLGHAAQLLVARTVHQDAYARTTKSILDELTDNERLKAVLGAQWFYWGTPPSRSAFAIAATAVADFAVRGVFYPVGGGAAIARELVRTIVDNGGSIQVNASVQEILVEQGEAVGVRVAGRHEQPDEVIRAHRVVSAVGVSATIQRLLPAKYRSSTWGQSICRLEPSTAYVSLFLGFDGDIAAAGASTMNHGFYDTWDIEAEWEIDGPDHVGRAPFMWACFNSLKDPLHEGPHTGEVMAFVPWRHFQAWTGSKWKNRPDEYERLKAALTYQLLDQFLEHIPKLRPLVTWSELSTPLSSAHFVRAIHGATYGLDHSSERFLTDALRPQTPIKGLYMAGTETVCVGVLGAGFSGLIAAAAAEPLGSLPMLRAVLV